MLKEVLTVAKVAKKSSLVFGWCRIWYPWFENLSK